MPLVTPAEVAAELKGDYDSNGRPDLLPDIEYAELLVQRVVAKAWDEGGITVSPREQKVMARLLAAFSYACSDKPYTSRSTMGQSASFSGQTGMGLDANLYGQKAKMFDPTGYLVQLFDDPPVQAAVEYLGRD